MNTAALRLSLFWFLFLGALGAFMPYYADHLKEVAGLPTGRVGLVLAMIPLAGILGQPLYGHLSDRTGSRRQVLAWLCVVAGFAFLVLGRLAGFGALLMGTAALSFHVSAIVPMLTATTMASLLADGQRSFGRVRLWGTVGFLVGAVGAPYLFEGVLFPLLAGVMLLCALTAWVLPGGGDVALTATPGEARRLLGHPPVRRALVFSFLAFLVLQGPILHFPLIVRARGGTLEAVSTTWLGMLLIEIPLIAWAGLLLRRLGPRGLLALGIGVEGARWLLSSLTVGLLPLQALQLVHGVGVVGVILGVPFYLEACIPRSMRSTGQALASVAGSGLGGMVSNAGFGLALERFGPSSPLLVCGALGLTLAALVPWLLPAPTRC